MEVKQPVKESAPETAQEPVKQTQKQAVEQSAPVKQAPAALDPAILAAINAAVSAAVVQTIAAMQPVAAPAAPAATLPAQAQQGKPAYTPRLKGIEVQPGQDLRHVHPNVINDWFNNLENRWKEQYNKKQVGGKPVNMNWTRG